MTTIKDILRDYGRELIELSGHTDNADGMSDEDLNQIESDLLDEYTDMIKERIVG